MIKRNWRWAISILLMSFIPLSTLIWSTAAARPRTPAASQHGISSAASAVRTPIYTNGNFTFTAPQELTGHPPSNIFSQAAAEPEIKVDIFGNIYVTAISGVPGGTDFWKSTNKGTSFVYLGQPDGAQDHCATLPECAGVGGGDDSIAVSTGGYLYVSSLWLGSVTMSASYDGGTGGVAPGQKWEVNPAAATIPGDDRQWVAAYGPQTVYMSYTDIATGVIDFEKSTDAGKTFSAPVQTYAVTSSILSDVQGNMVVDQYNGNIYICFIPVGLSNQVYINRSTDGGTTWTLHKAYDGPAGTTNTQVFPTMAVDRGGNVHVAFSSCGAGHSNCQIYLTSSIDQGDNWTEAVRVSNGSDTATAVEPTIAAGSSGVVDVAWLGSAAATPDVASNWHVFFAQTADALAANPTFAQNQVEAAVMHDQDICFNGLACASKPSQSPGNRDLLEYFSMAIDNDGNANIAYADSVTNCPSTTCVTKTWFTKQSNGSSAYISAAGPPAASFAPNVALPNSNTKAEPSLAVDSFNCMYASAPGGANIWKSVNAGASFAKLPNVPVLPTGGGDEDLLTLPATVRPATVYYADLAVADVSIRKSTDGGATWTSPGGGSAGELNASSDRQWIAFDLNGPNQNLYEMDHEFVSEAIRFASSTNDSPWADTSGITNPELAASTLPNTNPGPVFVNHSDHTVYGVFTSSIPTTNANQPPFGKQPNVWLAAGPGTSGPGIAPGPFVDYPVFKGVIDSPANPAPPAGSNTFGTSCANDFPAGDIDSAGNVYAAWAMNNARTNQYAVWLAVSHDGGKNFYGPFQLSSGPGSAEMPWVAAGDNGRVNVVFYQTNDVGDPNTTNLHWNMMFAQSLNANSREPAFTVSQASDHIMHFGPICNNGILCGSGTRVLLDYFEIAVGPDGLANIVFADTGNANSPSHLTFARQISGGLALTNPVASTCLAGPSIIPVSAVSRKTHGQAGIFDINLPLSGAAGIECRSGGANGDHTVVISFANAVSVGAASVVSSDGKAMVSSFNVNGPVVTVNLTKVTNAQTITIELSNVSDGTNVGNVSIPMGVLLGDINQDRFVLSGDYTTTRQSSGKPVNSDTFKNDVNTDGFILSGDYTIVRQHSGDHL